jgi:hypothetical protein
MVLCFQTEQPHTTGHHTQMSNDIQKEFWDKLYRILTQHFHQAEERLKGLVWKPVRKIVNQGVIAYTPVTHTLVYTPEFTQAMIKAQRGTDVNERIKIMFDGLHELMHAIAFVGVKVHSTTSCEMLAGIESSTVTTNSTKIRHRGLNECFVNYFVVKIVEKDPKFLKHPVNLNKFLAQRAGDARFMERIIGLVGEESVRAAYFEGKLDEMIEHFERRGINPIFFDLIDSYEPAQIGLGMQMIGISIPPENMMMIARYNMSTQQMEREP